MNHENRSTYARTAENLSKAQSVAMSIRQAMTGKGFSKKSDIMRPMEYAR